MNVYVIRIDPDYYNFALAELFLLIKDIIIEYIAYPIIIFKSSDETFSYYQKRAIFAKNMGIFLNFLKFNENYEILNFPIFDIKLLKNLLNKDSSIKISVQTFCKSLENKYKSTIIERLIQNLPYAINLNNPTANIIVHINFFDKQIFPNFYHKNLSKLPKNVFDENKKYLLFFELKSYFRKAQFKFNVNERLFIGTTMMDNYLTVFMLNSLNIKKNDIVYDPFLGSGGIPLVCSLLSIYSIGTELSRKELFGRFKQNGNVKTSILGTNIFSNFEKFKTMEYFLGCVVGNCFDVKIGNVDYVVCDPPYGIRAGGEFNINLLKILFDKTNAKGICFWVIEKDEVEVEKVFKENILILKIKQKLNTCVRILFVYER